VDGIREGFDDARLDTLFLTMPITWKGSLAQYVGRLHRRYAGKSDVLVVDYVDAAVPVLARMATKRRAGYRMLGSTIEERSVTVDQPPAQYFTVRFYLDRQRAY
jgi:superfamily II DNA or RNA helicase